MNQSYSNSVNAKDAIERADPIISYHFNWIYNTIKKQFQFNN